MNPTAPAEEEGLSASLNEPLLPQPEGMGSPTSEEENDGDIPWYKCPLQLVAMLSNYSTSYNVVNISMVIPILEHTLKAYNSEDVAASASSLLAGMIVGQLGGGYLGDTPQLGRLGALQLVMVLQVVASLGSALLPSHNPQTFFVWLAIMRFLLGVGAGGVYPLAAVLSAEQGSHNNKEQQTEEERIKRVVLTFSTQGLGFITVPLLATLLLCMTSNLNAVWRLLLAFGSLPGLVLMGAQMWIHRHNRNNPHEMIPTTETEETQEEEEETPPPAPVLPEQPNDNEEELIRDLQLMNDQLRQPPTQPQEQEHLGWWDSILKEPDLWTKLLGTAGTWFLFDVLFYGNSLFQPIVLDAAFGASHHKNQNPMDEIRDTAIKSLFVYGIALPGYAVAGLVMGKKIWKFPEQTPRYVMLQGFAAMGILYLALGTNWTALKQTPVLLVLMYGLTFFFANYGPNTTTFILPSMVFGEDCRSTLNGVSAAAGKLGALTGATLFEPLVEDIGDAHVMTICALVAITAFAMTYSFVPAHAPTTVVQPLPTNGPPGHHEVV